jgi:hypothetical protein
MIRKFGYDEIYRFAGEGDEKKVLVGIRRKKERAKKRKASAGDGDEEEGVSFFSSLFHIFLFPSISRSISISISFDHLSDLIKHLNLFHFD